MSKAAYLKDEESEMKAEIGHNVSGMMAEEEAAEKTAAETLAQRYEEALKAKVASDQKVTEAEEAARDAKQRATEAEEAARDAEQRAIKAEEAARDAEQRATESEGKLKTLEAENTALQQEKDTLVAEKAALQQEKDTLVAEKAALQQEKDAFAAWEPDFRVSGAERVKAAELSPERSKKVKELIRRIIDARGQVEAILAEQEEENASSEKEIRDIEDLLNRLF